MMTSTHLNPHVRNTLRDFARTNISVPEEETAVEEAYRRVVTLLVPVVESRYPRADMAVLDQHRQARRDSCVRCVERDTERRFRFVFRDADAPLVPIGHRASLDYVIDQASAEAIETYRKCEVAHNAARVAILNHYSKVISGARYAEDILEAWPASAAILEPFIEKKRKAFSADVSDEILAVVRKHNVGAGAIAEAA